MIETNHHWGTQVSRLHWQIDMSCLTWYWKSTWVVYLPSVLWVCMGPQNELQSHIDLRKKRHWKIFEKKRPSLSVKKDLVNSSHRILCSLIKSIDSSMPSTIIDIHSIRLDVASLFHRLSHLLNRSLSVPSSCEGVLRLSSIVHWLKFLLGKASSFTLQRSWVWPQYWLQHLGVVKSSFTNASDS